MRAVCADQRLKVGASPGTLSVAPGSVRKAAERPDKDCRELFQGLRARSALDSGTIVGEHSLHSSASTFHVGPDFGPAVRFYGGAMCLTLGNASAVFEHRARPTACGGYTETMHQVGHLAPGDLWRPIADRPPHVVTNIRNRQDTVTITDQLGQVHRYPADTVVPTAVPDPLVLLPRSA
jgi:hypothetical protein